MVAKTSRQKSSLPPLSWPVRAHLFSHLAAMETAGLPVTRALALLRMSAPQQQRVAMACKWLARGASLSVAGYRSGLFNELEANLVEAASSAGSPASTYRRLATYYTQRAAQMRTIKARLALPALVFVIGLLVQPLPALLGGSISLADYFLHSVGSLAAIGMFFFLWTTLLRRQGGTKGYIAMALPLFGKMLVRRNIRDFFESLGLMLEAGIPILQALPKALDTIQLGALRKAFDCIESEIERGSTLTQALTTITCLNNGEALALISTGEASGRLPEMLFRYAAMETNAINNFNKQVSDWLPRIVYAAVAAWMAYGILSGADLDHHLRTL